MSFSRLALLPLIPLILDFASCSRRAHVEHEAVVRTRVEAFDEELHGEPLKYDFANGQRAFRFYCAGCHGANGDAVHSAGMNSRTLGLSANEDLRRFWKIANFGEDGTKMRDHFDDIPFRDMVDLTGYAQTLKK